MKNAKGRPCNGLVPWLFLWMIAVQASGQGFAPPAGTEPQPLASEGNTTTFRYWRSPSATNAYMVQPIGNTGFTFQVSESYLGLVVNSPPIDDKTRLSVLIQYPFYMDQLYQSRIQTSYPDAQRSYDAPFAPFAAENLQITQDNMASPYVRVRITEPGVPGLEFSVNRAVVDQLLTEGSVVGTNLIAALRKYSYRLPEEARNRFSYLTSTQIMAMAAESIPAVSGQEFVRARRWYGDSPTKLVPHPDATVESSDAAEPIASPDKRIPRARVPASALTPPSVEPSATKSGDITEAKGLSMKGPTAVLLALLAALMGGSYYWLVHRQR